MRCARRDCPKHADVVVDFGEGLLVMLCAGDAVLAPVEHGGRRITRTIGAGSPDVTIRPRGA